MPKKLKLVVSVMSTVSSLHVEFPRTSAHLPYVDIVLGILELLRWVHTIEAKRKI